MISQFDVANMAVPFWMELPERIAEYLVALKLVVTSKGYSITVPLR